MQHGRFFGNLEELISLIQEQRAVLHEKITELDEIEALLLDFAEKKSRGGI